MISMYTSANQILGMNQLAWQGWLITISLSLSIIPAVEFAKLLKIN
jgi:hypothetical protein